MEEKRERRRLLSFLRQTEGRRRSVPWTHANILSGSFHDSYRLIILYGWRGVDGMGEVECRGFGMGMGRGVGESEQGARLCLNLRGQQHPMRPWLGG